MSDIVDWSDLPKSLFVIGARSADGVVFDVQTCSVPMALAPEVEYVRAAEITRLRAALAQLEQESDAEIALLRDYLASAERHRAEEMEERHRLVLEVIRLRADLAAAQEREQRMRGALALIAVVDQGCGGNLSFKEMAESAMRQARAALSAMRGEP